jgi:hypothetical protein
MLLSALEGHAISFCSGNMGKFNAKTYNTTFTGTEPASRSRQSQVDPKASLILGKSLGNKKRPSSWDYHYDKYYSILCF